MQNQNKILLKQTLLLISISILFYFLGSIGSYVLTYGGPDPLWFYLIFYAYLFFMLLIFIPISIIYLMRIRKNANLIGLNVAFKIFSWLFISTLLTLFLVWLVLDIFINFYIPFPDYSVLKNIWLSIKYIDIGELANLLFYVPYLIFAGLLYWAVKINKSFNIGITNN